MNMILKASYEHSRWCAREGNIIIKEKKEDVSTHEKDFARTNLIDDGIEWDQTNFMLSTTCCYESTMINDIKWPKRYFVIIFKKVSIKECSKVAGLNINAYLEFQHIVIKNRIWPWIRKKRRSDVFCNHKVNTIALSS